MIFIGRGDEMVDWDKFRERARAKAKSTSATPVWKPQKEGDELYGQVIYIVPNPWDESVNSYIVKTPDGQEFMTPRNEVLVMALKRANPGVGDLLYIRYEGISKPKPGRSPAKLFSVYVEKMEEPEPAEPATPPAVETAEEVEEIEEAPPSEEDEKIRKYLKTLATIYVAPLSWRMLQKHLEAKGIFMQPSELKRLPERFPDVLEVTADGKGVRLKK
jgi:hypothetical protein